MMARITGDTPISVALQHLRSRVPDPAASRPGLPAPVFVVPGVIPLVPGYLAFRTMIDMLTLTTTPGVDEVLLLTAAVNSLETILIVGGIAAGVAVPSLLLRRHRPMT